MGLNMITNEEIRWAVYIISWIYVAYGFWVLR